MAADITLRNVDVDLLERQRLALQAVLSRLHACSDKTRKDLLGISGEQYELLQGLENMLDAWSDERYYREQEAAKELDMVKRVLDSVAGMFTDDLDWKMTDLDGVKELAERIGYEFPEGANKVREDDDDR